MDDGISMLPMILRKMVILDLLKMFGKRKQIEME